MKYLLFIVVCLMVLVMWVFITPWLFSHGSSAAFKMACATIFLGIIAILYSLSYLYK